jgi:hypothetical protein
MAKVQYKSKKGVFHIGGGRFFHAQKPVEVSEEESEQLLKTYSDLELVTDPNEKQEGSNANGQDDAGEKEKHTKSSIKKLNADEQRELIVDLGGNPEETSNEDERIALILQLQEEKQEESE